MARRSDRGDLPPLPHAQLGADPAGSFGVQMLTTDQEYHQQGNLNVIYDDSTAVNFILILIKVYTGALSTYSFSLIIQWDDGSETTGERSTARPMK